MSIEDELLASAARAGGYRALRAVLDEPPALVQEFWREGASTAAAAARAAIASGKDVFLTFHAVYHTDKFGDFYSPVDGRLLREFPPPDHFLTFIDDVGDVRRRLHEDGEVFSTRPRDGVESVKATIRDLLTLLEWRSGELMVSRALGTSVGRPPFILAVKHPLVTAGRLLLGEGTPTYISHAISEPRREYKASGTGWPPPFVEELQSFTDSLADPSLSPNVVPIVPTSIDEFRIDRNEDGVHVPGLLPPWPIPRGAPLVADHSPTDFNWLDPYGHFAARGPGHADETAGLLEALASRIENQVNARDHLLVSQCRGFAVYRPYVAWRISRGVGAEIRHRAKGPNRSGTVFLHRPGDERLRALGVVVEMAAGRFLWTAPPRRIDKKTISTTLKRLLKGDPLATFTAEAIAKHVTTLLEREGIRLSGPTVLEEQGVLGKRTATDEEREVRAIWGKMAIAGGGEDPFRKFALPENWVSEELAAEGFAVRLNAFFAPAPSVPASGRPRRDRRRGGSDVKRTRTRRGTARPSARMQKKGKPGQRKKRKPSR